MTTPKSLIREAESDSRNRGPIAVSDFWTKPVGGTIKTNQVYAHFCETLTVVPQIVFYETMSGARMGDNPFAIFDYLQTHRKYQNLLHVWSVNDRENVPEEYRNSPNVVFAHRHSRAYAYFLARAGYVIGNANLPEYFVRRSEQRYLNTWHGIPYKALGRDSPKARFGSWQGTASFLKATHVVTPCRFMTDAVLSAYSMAGTSQALIAETGYPRVDMTVNPSNDRVSAICDILGITGSSVSAAPHKPVVLYAPTWRSDGKQDTVDSEQLLDDLSALAQLDINLLYRGHHRMDKMVGDRMVGDELANITIPPHDISSNELLSVVDILITDYSSIFFDFLPTGRPIIHYVYDLDEYAPTRGLNLTTDELPGTVAKSREDLVRGVNEAAKALAQAPSDADLAANPLQGARYAAAQRRFCPYEDGQATERVVKFFFQDDAGSSPVTYPRDERPTVVYWAGSPGKTAVATEFLAEVIRSGELATEQTTGVFERSASMKADFLKSIKSLKHDLSTVAYVRDTPMLLSSEQQTYSKFEELESPSITEVEKLLDDDPALRKIFSREYRRRLDNAHFDKLVLGPNLSNFELGVASFACRPEALASDVVTPHEFSAQRRFNRVKRVLIPCGSKRRRVAVAAYRRVKAPLKKLAKR
ncbi:CDP-glycerol glycerophosphotransferase family protein [Ancrocorticia populi]|uniref:Uncharacterized protein n=1 Tax=Ancrocorticia populi TaxID=2175228 RepID=A0A2V1KAQ9_9ACTO|nr:CDP-glycerol glycerophosphotransferase family protein [Ancrocorticia populi]PWF27400.1 hypothetical protein DD236_03165 [Ancrocorticia populi]